MSQLTDFLTQLRSLGVKLWAENSRLRYSAPQGVLTPELKAQLVASKTEILNFLADVQVATDEYYPIPPIPKDKPLPLSFAQTRLWFLEQFEGQSNAYNEFIALELKGELRVSVLEKSLTQIVQRHQILRTVFPLFEEIPQQVIHPPYTVSLPITNLQNLPSDERLSTLKVLAQKEIEKPFDLSQGPLWKLILYKIDDQHHVLLLVIHHIIFDGWSLGVFLKELSSLYTAFYHDPNGENPLADLTIQYADFAVWQREWLQGDILNKQLNYWKQQLTDAAPVLQFPTDYPRPAKQTFQGESKLFEINNDLIQKLEVFSQQSGVSLFMTLLTAFAILLYRYTSQNDMIIGSPVANRNRSEIEPLIGFFVNTLPLRIKVESDFTFEQLLGQVRQVTLDAYTHQDIPFEKLVEEIEVVRDLSHSPIFQVVFALQNTGSKLLEIPDIKVNSLFIPFNRSRFDLFVALEEVDQKILCYLEYNTDLYKTETIARFFGHFQILLGGIVANPQEKIGELPLLTPQEKHQILVEWNQTKTQYPQDQCIHQLFEEQVRKSPEAIAVVYQEEQLTYQQLNEKANQLAHYLQELGVTSETLVGVCVERSVEMVIGILAILKAGGAYVPLDPEYPKERLSFILDDTQVKVLLTQEKLINYLPTCTDSLIGLDSHWKLIAQYSQDNPTNRNHVTDLAYVMYTSGSTGQPKGVSIVHRGVVRLVKQTHYVSLSEKEVFLQVAPFCFDAATFEIWGSLLNGGKLIIFPPNLPSINQLAEVIKEYSVTTLWLTAGLFHLMVAEKIDALKSLRQLLAGGDILSGSHVQKFLQNVENCQLINGYGPTENTTFTCCYTIPKSLSPDISVPIGHPISNTQVYILDKNLQPVPIGVPGEIHIAGVGLARGYLNREDLTQEKFIKNPFDERGETRVYKSGDLGRYLPDGNIEFLGRIDHQVKLRGFRIELGEIESVLKEHPDITDALIILGEDHNQEPRLVAYIVTAMNLDRIPYEQKCEVIFEGKILALKTEDISLTGVQLKGNLADLEIGKKVQIKVILPEEDQAIVLHGKVVWLNSERGGVETDLKHYEQERLQQSLLKLSKEQKIAKIWQRTLTKNLSHYLKQRLPEYMIPDLFVVMENFPLTPNGKVDRKALPSPDFSIRNVEQEYIPPHTETQQKIANIWRNLLGVDQVGIRDNFFELGGHSLLATQVVSRLQEIFRIKLSLQRFFEVKNLAELADVVVNQQLELVTDDSLEQMLTEIEQLSDEDVKQQLLTE